jgi:hypothetical protein
VIEVADVFRRFAGEYLSAHGAAMPPSHRRAIADIQACRTEALGGRLWRCDQCDAEVFSYHSCKNRSCPKCHSRQTERWLEARKAEMLPTRYFHVTVTVPEELRDTLRANQRDGYAVLMKAAADAIVELARDRRYVGATVGVLAVLHTWTQQLLHHPHVHCLVTGGGVSNDGDDWRPARKAFLVPVKALAKLVRGKLRAALQKKGSSLFGVGNPAGRRRPIFGEERAGQVADPARRVHCAVDLMVAKLPVSEGCQGAKLAGGDAQCAPLTALRNRKKRLP